VTDILLLSIIYATLLPGTVQKDGMNFPQGRQDMVIES